MENQGPIIPEKRYSRISREKLTIALLMGGILVAILLPSLLIYGTGMGSNFVIGIVPYPIIIIGTWVVIYAVNRNAKNFTAI